MTVHFFLFQVGQGGWQLFLKIEHPEKQQDANKMRSGIRALFALLIKYFIKYKDEQYSTIEIPNFTEIFNHEISVSYWKVLYIDEGCFSQARKYETFSAIGVSRDEYAWS